MKFNELITEIKMNPKSLMNVASQLNAKIGIEYEFIYQFRDIAEPELIDVENKNITDNTSITQVINFFKSSDIEPENLDIYDEIGKYLKTQYNEWLADKIKNNKFNDEDYPNFYSIFISYKKPHIQKAFTNAINDSNISDENFGKYEIESLHNTYNFTYGKFYSELTNEEIEDIIPELKNELSKSKLTAYLNVRKPIYNNIINIANKLIDGKNIDGTFGVILKSLDNFNPFTFFNENYGNNMLSIYNKLNDNFDLSWPQKYSDDAPTIDKVSENFVDYESNLIGEYSVETDGSIRVDDENYEIGVEIKNSYPLSLEETIHDFKLIREYIETNGYTNDTTGLHINVSLPNYKLENLDYVKLVLLLGDEYILQKFNRLKNTYAQPALNELIKTRNDPAQILDKLQVQLNQLAGKVFFNSYTDKYTSVNIQRDRIEFRSPGDDWVSDQSTDFMIQTMLRFIVALDAALDPTKYQKEYAKKIYKWIEPDKGYLKDITKAFAMYSIGKLNKEKLKQIISNIQEVRPKRGSEYETQGDYYAFGTNTYLWGSGVTKLEALEDSYNAVLEYNRENKDNLVSWAAERRNGTFFPIDKFTHDSIQKGLVTRLHYDNNKKIYVYKK